MADLTDRKIAILRYLGNGQLDLGDFQRSVVIADGAGLPAELGGVRGDLDVLNWNGLVEQHPHEEDRFRITPDGMVAVGL